MFFEVADVSYLARCPQARTNIDGQIPLPAVRTQIGVVIRGMDRVLIDANTFPAPDLFSAHSASIRPEACRPPCPDIAHQPAVLLLRHEHALAVSGVEMSILGRRFAEIVEHEDPQRRTQRVMRRLAFCHIAANVVGRAEFAPANLDHRVPHLRLEPDAGPVPVDLHIANHERAAFIWTGIFTGRAYGHS